MIDSEDYPLMTVSELARALRVPREFIFAHAHELGFICLRLRDANGRASARFAAGRSASHVARGSLCTQ
jgi:hypothetical protein